MDSDVYNIATRIKELDPNLIIVLTQSQQFPFSIYEFGRDNEYHLVKRYAELGEHVLNDLRYMASVPLAERTEKVMKEVEDHNNKMQRMDEGQAEEFAELFHREMVKAGLTDPHFFSSYRKVRK